MKQCTACILHEITSHLQVRPVNFNDFISKDLNQHITEGILRVRVHGNGIHNNVAAAGFTSYLPEFERINTE